MAWRFSLIVFFFQAEDGIRDLVRSRGLGDVYKRQLRYRGVRGSRLQPQRQSGQRRAKSISRHVARGLPHPLFCGCLLYTSDAADERSSVDLGGRRIIKKKKK